MYVKIYSETELDENILSIISENSEPLRFDYFRDDEDSQGFPYEYFAEFEESDEDGNDLQVILTESDYANLQEEFRLNVLCMFGILDASNVNYRYSILDCYEHNVNHPSLLEGVELIMN